MLNGSSFSVLSPTVRVLKNCTRNVAGGFLIRVVDDVALVDGADGDAVIVG
jgi:hypothetical protein